MNTTLARLAKAGDTGNVHAKAGETIRGSLGRGDAGQFVNAKSGGGKKGKGRKAAKPKQTPEQKTQAKAAEATKNRAAVAKQMQMGNGEMDALQAFGAGKDLSPDDAKRLEAIGAIERGADGTPRMASAGTALLRAASKGDVRAAGDAISRGRDAVAASQQKTQATTDRKAKVAERAKSSAERKVQAAQRRTKARVHKTWTPTQRTQAHREADAIVKTFGSGDGSMIQKAFTPAASWHGWAAITKIDSQEHIVQGIASTDSVDSQPGIWKGEAYEGDVVDADAIQAALPDYMQWGALREMHQPSAVGTVVKAEVIDGKLHIRAKIVDDAAWKKIEAGVYKGFSIGGKCLHALLEKLGLRIIRRVVKMALTEISLVDRPANPDARILLFKGADMETEQPATEVAEDTITKAADPSKAIALLQQLRNDAENGGDMDAADSFTRAIRETAEGAGIATTAADDESADAAAPDDESVLAMDDAVGDVAMSATATDLRKAFPNLSDDGLIDLLLKRGAAISGSTMGHLRGAHDSLQKATGGAVCPQPGQAIQLAETLAPGDLAKALAPAFDGVAKGLEKIGVDVSDLTKRLEHLESQEAPGAPAVRAVDKTLPGETPAAPANDAAIELSALRKLRDGATDDITRKALAYEITKREIRNVYRPI